MNLISMRLTETALALSVLGLSCTAAAQSKSSVPESGAPVSAAKLNLNSKGFVPPDATAIPDNEFGKMVRKGQDIFLETGRYAGGYVGNSLNCVNCHLDAGRRANAAPLWAAYVLYPAYRSKNGHVNTLAERLQGCFQYSMNGKMPPADSDIIVALESYMYWMAQQAPTGVKLKGRGYPRLPEPAQAPDYVRGQAVYKQNCALCHGAEGQGQSTEGKKVFPALWGDDSFNWGAGMHSVSTAAAFIKANMPLSRGGTLTDQQAWDVARYMNSHERPQDPRYNGSLEETRKKFHDDPSDLYGQTVNGVVLGENATPSGGKLRAEDN